MKSLVNSLLYIAYGVCNDVRMAYPRLKGVDLDCERLARNSQTRGLGLFVLDLPELDTMLTRGLESGRLVLRGPFSRMVSEKIRVPRFLSGLWLRVFDADACLKEDADVNSIMFLRQIFCLGKRIELGCSPSRLQKAVKEYHDIEHRTRPPDLNWSEDVLDPGSIGDSLHLRDAIILRDGELFEQQCSKNSPLSGILERVQQVADLISTEIGFCEPVTYSGDLHDQGRPSGFRHGPGAVSDRTGIVDKYHFPRWSLKLEEWFPYRTCGTIASDMDTMPLNHEVASRLIAVAKTAKAPRLIASEPTEHQWCQQVIRHFMVSRLRTIFGKKFVCFEEQELSGQMALRASLDRSLATIDLSSASDRLSCYVVERMLRRNSSLLHCLHAARTRYIRDDISLETSFIKLKKFASQGTATTFPVQTLIFLCIAIGVTIKGKITWNKIRRLGSQVRVFGDDIIIPNARYAEMTSTLTALGLMVNEDKSFHIGHFRESCGVDGFKGFDITPIKPKTVISGSPASRQAILDTTNNLFYKGYWHASDACKSTLGDRLIRRLPVVGRDTGTPGLASFCGNSFDHLPRRWNELLHRNEYKVIEFSTRVPWIQYGERPALLQYFTEAPGFGPSLHDLVFEREASGTRNIRMPRSSFRQLPRGTWRTGYAGRPKPREGLRWSPLY